MAQDLRPASSVSANTLDASNGFIEHHVSKLDTLAGVAIKYGVEVADVKRLNGLVSDFQMFAHKTLRIPVGRRHPASSTSNRSENSSLSGCPLSSGRSPKLSIQRQTINNHEKRVRDKRPLSSAMNLLRGYYGLSSPAQQAVGNDAGMEMASYKAEIEDSDDEVFSPIAVPVMATKNGHKNLNGVHNSRLSIREVEGLLKSANGQISHSEVLQTSALGDSSNERSVRRRFKTDAIPATCDDVDCKWDTGVLDKSLPASGPSGPIESSGGLPVVMLKVLDGALVSGKGKESPVKVKKSSSTSNLQDETSSIKSVSPFNQGGSRTSFEVPPKPMNYRFKAALD